MDLAEFNIGTLRYDWDDPRVADFQNNLDRVYDIARRSPGYVWHLEGDEMEAAQLDASGPLGGNPRTASTLSVWESVAAFRTFTFDTVHRVFMDRGDEWHLPKTGPSLVMWWIAPGQRPTVAEAVARLAHLEAHGETDHAFGWEHALASS
ncbi:MAG: DUF3291 domain-containing protein [Pseudomonadota bacterium]